jgi:DNA adenine methylase
LKIEKGNRDTIFSGMKTPITYYGGKQKMVTIILPRIPQHVLYCEPFIGGGAVFWAKPPSEVEVINDTNRELINFYRIVQQDFVSLEKEVRISLHSRDIYNDALHIYQRPKMFSELKRAWAVWVLTAMGFSSILGGSFGYDIAKRTTSKKIRNKRENFTEEFAIRLQEVQIECADAIRIIRSRDSINSFFYVDPPYFNSDMGHYDGYTKEDFEMLLDALSKIEGKFLLSSYPSDILSEYVKRNKWQQLKVESLVTVNNKGKNPKKKMEVLTANYPLQPL